MWNGWSESEKAAQLAMSLRGVAQRVLSELNPTALRNYEILKYTLMKGFALLNARYHIAVSLETGDDSERRP